MTHIQQTYRRAGRQKLYRKLRGYGIHHGIFFPVVTWEERVSKYTRMREEAWHIWSRDANLNAIGARSWDAADKKKMDGGADHTEAEAEKQGEEADGEGKAN